jgi:DNA-binding CsgD family transcriptional regulator
MSNVLKHYGIPRRSGRYPWGSGGDPYQNAIGFRGHIQELKKQGKSEVDIAKGEGISISQLRTRLSLAKTEQREGDRRRALQLKDKGYSNMEIARQMSGQEKTWNESSIRSLLDSTLAERASITATTAKILKESVDKQRFVDIGSGVEVHMGISRTKLNTAVEQLVGEGYKVHKLKVRQMGLPDQFTHVKVLGAPDTKWKEIYDDPSKIKSVMSHSEDFGRSFRSDLGVGPLQHVNSKRIQVKYAEDGGNLKDGVIELRRGVKDLDLGGKKYAQVRISVDGTHFLKGMAIYNDDLPEGTDIIFNTNKSRSVGKMGALKGQKPDLNDQRALEIIKEVKSRGLKKDEEKTEIESRLGKAVKNGEVKPDPDNPFGATIKRQSGSLNIVNEEGDWEKWSKTISSQILSKQAPATAKKQLDEAYSQKKEEYDEIMTLTNPVVKRQLLNSFADDCDSSSVHLKAAALPRQASKVILPIPGLKETEVYAPTFRDGEVVVLIRHPHAGTFEIPQLTVNNKSKPAKAIMENAPDAVGIHPKVAQKLSGADFDGDAVIVIPNKEGRIKTSPSLKDLEGFDPIERYRIPEGSNIPKISPRTKQTKMGEVSNLITDMTIKGAPLDEIARAVKHSMVVIDSEKHNLDYKQSYIDNRIAELSERYQNGKRGGASTLISKASSEIRVPHRKMDSKVDPQSGKKTYRETGEVYTNAKGKVIRRTLSSTKMAEVSDARELSSGRQIEEIYAGYANNLKALANESRKQALKIIPTPYSSSARIAYAKEVDTLNAQLNVALKNKPLERQAQILANSIVKRKQQANPNMEADELKKIRNQALAEARVRAGTNRYRVNISDKEWEAIQAGAITASKLTQILDNSNLDQVKRLATPRATTLMSPTKIKRAKTLLDSGATLADIADTLGVSTSTLSNALK